MLIICTLNIIDMKKTLLYLSLMAFILFSCETKAPDNPEPPKPPVVDIPITDVVIPDVGNYEAPLTFTINGSWTTELSDTKAIPAWFDVNPKSGDAGTHTLIITLKEPNETYDDRIAYLKIKTGGSVSNVTVTQKKKDALLLTQDRYEIPASGGNFTVEVKSNVTDYQVVIPDESTDWIVHQKTKGLTTQQELFTVAPCLEDIDREGMVVFISNNLKDTVHVYQSNEKSATEDREALIAFYNSTNGENWNNNTNWGSDKPLNEWYGIVTNHTGEVIELRFLEENNIKGQIPAELFDIVNLQSIYLWNQSNLSGEIPTEIGNLKYLSVLSIVYTKLEGQIPSSIGHIASLTGIFLKNNLLSGKLPNELGNLTYLTSFDISNNNIGGELPKELAKLTRLVLSPDGFNISNNRFTGKFPDEFYEMPSWSLYNKEYIFNQQNGYGFEFASQPDLLKDLGDGLYLHKDDMILYCKPSMSLESIQETILSKFEDNFDMLFIISDEDQSVFALGVNTVLSNKVEGIGMSIFNITQSNRLLSLITFNGEWSFSNRTIYHEITHNWAARFSCLPKIKHVDENLYRLKPDDLEGHWSTTNVFGLLGGFSDEMVTKVGDNRYYVPQLEPSLGVMKYYLNNSPKGYGQDDIYYAPLELYAMGLLHKNDVPPIDVYDNAVIEAEMLQGGNFAISYITADKKTYTIDDIIAKDGARVPDYANSQKEFRIITVRRTNTVAEAVDWDKLNLMLKKISYNKDDNDPKFTNFWEATHMNGKLSCDQLSKDLKK